MKAADKGVRGAGLSGWRRFAILAPLLWLLANGGVASMAFYNLEQSRAAYEQRAVIMTQNLASLLEGSVHSFVEKIDLTLRTVGDELERELA